MKHSQGINREGTFNASKENDFSVDSKWVKPEMICVEIEKLTEGFGPNFKDFKIPLLAAS